MAICDECRNEQRIAALEKDSERNQATHKEFFSKFEDLKVNSAKSDEKYVRILEAISELKGQVSELISKPAKRWDAIIMALIAAVIGGIIGHFVK